MRESLDARELLHFRDFLVDQVVESREELGVLGRAVLDALLVGVASLVVDAGSAAVTSMALLTLST